MSLQFAVNQFPVNLHRLLQYHYNPKPNRMLRQRLLFFVCLLFISTFTLGQKKEEALCLKPEETPLTDSAFAKMMLDNYRLTIGGSNTIATGFKVETNKPNITLNGTVISDKMKRFIGNLQLNAGVKDNIGQVFSKGKLNGFFKVTPSFNLMPGLGKGFYNADGEKCIILKRNMRVIDANRDALLMQLDSSLILEQLFQDPLPATFADLVKNVQTKNGDAFNILKVRDIKGDPVNYTRPSKINSTDYYEKLAAAMIEKYNAEFKRPAGVTDAVYYEALYKDVCGKLSGSGVFEKLDQLVKDRVRMKALPSVNQQQAVFSVDKLADIWVVKRIWWLNASPFVSNSGTTLLDTLKQKLVDTASWTYGIQLSANMFRKYKQPGRFLFLKIAGELKRIDNIDELSKFDYESKSPITPSGQVNSAKSGTAWKGDLKYGLGASLFAELYHTPLKQPFLPGYYVNVTYKHGEVWLNNNKVSAELGLMWNITNNDKDSKNLLSIIPYFGFSNLLTDYKDVSKEDKYTLADLFYVNVKFGIPINIGK
jgi:hypothetical protein